MTVVELWLAIALTSWRGDLGPADRAPPGPPRSRLELRYHLYRSGYVVHPHS